MAASRDPQEYNHYIQCHEAIQIFCKRAVCPVVENVISNWHRTKQVILHRRGHPVILQPCSRPGGCHARVQDNKRRRWPQDCPVYPPPCWTCEQWCHAIESLYWTSWSFGAPVTWGNINLSRLYHDPIELAKAFAISLPPGHSPTSFDDFDPACLLKIAMRFGECHRFNQQDHDVIQNVYNVRNNLCHKRVSENMQLSLHDRNQYFDAIFKLVNVLERLHLNFFPSARANEIRDELQNIQSNPVTPEMEERATKPLTAEMKQWLQSTLESLKRKQTDEICDKVEKQARQIEDTVCKDTRNIQADVTEIKNLMTGQQSEAGLKQDIQSWRQTLQAKYRCERSQVSIGKGWIHRANMEDIFVDINILEEEARGDNEHPSTSVNERREQDVPETADISEQHENKTRNKKQLESYHEILAVIRQSKLSNVALIRGDAGTGKTTLLSRIAYEWAKAVPSLEGEQEDASASEVNSCWSQWTQFDLLFLLDIRKLKTAESLIEAIRKHLLPGVGCKLIEKVMSSLGTQCLILLDGFDEMSLETWESEDNAFDSPLLGRCFVIVTTRAHTVDRFCEMRISSGCVHFEISGFDTEKSYTYIDKFFAHKDKSQLGEDLKVKLEATPALCLLSSIPILLLMICLLCRDKGIESLSNTVTGLYQNAIQYLNKPFTTRRGGRKCLDKKQVDEMLVELGNVAFDSLLKNQLHMDKKTFGNDEMLEQAFQMGLCSQEDTGLVDQTVVSFVHKTFQEYCAAKYLTALLEESRESFAARLEDMARMNILAFEFVLRFCCGMHPCCIDVVLPFVGKGLKLQQLYNHLRQHYLATQWRIPLLLFYEAGITYRDLDWPSLTSHLEAYAGTGARLVIASPDVMEALIYFTTHEPHPMNEWLSRIFQFHVRWFQIPINIIMRLLRSMTCLATMTLTNVFVLGELDSRQAQPCQSLYEMNIRCAQIEVQTLVNLLGYLKSLKILVLEGVVFKGELKGNHHVVCPIRELKILYYSWHELEVCSDISSITMTHLLAHMPYLSILYLEGVTIDGILDANIRIQLKNLNKFELRKSTVDAGTLITSMKSMDQHAIIDFERVHLVGKLNVDVESAHPSYLKIAPNCSHASKCTCPGRVIELGIFMSFISTMTSLAFEQNPVSKEDIESSFFRMNCVEMCNIDLVAGTLCHSELSLKSVKCFNMSFGSIGADSFMKFLRSMPLLYHIRLESVHIVGKLDSKYSSPVLIQSVEYVRLHLLSVSPDTLKTIMMCFPSLHRLQLICPSAACISHCASVLPQTLGLLELTCEASEETEAVHVQSGAIVRCLESKPALYKVSLRGLHIEGDTQESLSMECKCLKTFLVEQCTVNAMTLRRYLQYMPMLKYLILDRNAIQGNLNLSSYEESICNYSNTIICCSFINTVVSFCTVVQILCSMPSVQTVALGKVIDKEGVDNFPSLKYVKNFILVDATVHINTLVKILRGIPAVETIDVRSDAVHADNNLEPGLHLRQVDVKGDLLRTVPKLCKCVTRVFFSDSSISLITALRMISSMSCVTDVHFNSSQLLPDESCKHETILCHMVKHLDMLKCKLTADCIMYLLSCMPTVARVVLWKLEIMGELDRNSPKVQLKCLRKLTLSNINNTAVFLRLMQMMPNLQELYGLDCRLVSSLGLDLPQPCFPSVKLIEMIGNQEDQEGCLKASTLSVVVRWFPFLEEVRLVDAFWTNDLNADVHFKLIKDFSITCIWHRFISKEKLSRLGRGRKLHSLKEAFGCFQSLDKVTLDDVDVPYELDADGMNETIKECTLSDTDICFQTLVKFIKWMKKLRKMEAVKLRVSGESDPSAVVHCQSLHELDLEIENEVEAAPVMNFLCCFPELQKLDLGLRIFQDIPDCDVRWQSLSELMLFKMSDLHVNAVLRFLTLMPVLYKLKLKRVCLKGEVDVVLAEQVRSSSRIRILEMANVKVDEILLRQVLGYTPSLQTIRVVVENHVIWR